jgi:hypothetical protein
LRPLKKVNVFGCERRALFAMLLGTVSLLKNLLNMNAKSIKPPSDGYYA